jgi:hypothetical protein
MYYTVDEFLDEYDELTSQILSSDYRYVALRFQQWFELLETGDDGVAAHIKHLERMTNWAKIEKDNLNVGRGMAGSGAINIPKNRDDRLAFHLVLFRRLSSGGMDIPNFSHEYFATRSNNINETTSNMLHQLFEPFANELRRYVKRAYDEPEPEDSEAEEPQIALDIDVPASDRVVTINHNAPEFQAISTGLEGIEEQLRGNNGLDIDLKGQALAELSASRALLSANRVRLSVVRVVVVGMLLWIGQVFAETLLGNSIQALLPKIYAVFPGLV